MIRDRRYGFIYIFLALWTAFVARQRDITAAWVVAALFLALGLLKLLKYFREQKKK